MNNPILIVDDEIDFLQSMQRVLRLQNYHDVVCESVPTKVEHLLAQNNFAVALLDITMPELDGLSLLKMVREKSPYTLCIMVTAHDDVQLVVKAMKLGAHDYLIKPIDINCLKTTLKKTIDINRSLKRMEEPVYNPCSLALKNMEAFAEIQTLNPGMLRLLHEAELQAESDIPVLITGETGVGKELLAFGIHKASHRKNGPFVAINMLSLSPTLFESEIFGHSRGAFTGAVREHRGYLDQAQNGTIFFDEIGDLSPEIQGKLLRLLQEQEYVPIGQTQAKKANIRFVTATNRDLEKLVSEGKFRKDLFYRLQFAKLHIPPLRHRREDVPLIAADFLAQISKGNLKLSNDAVEKLLSYDYPGNVRELKGIIQSAANRTENGLVEQHHLHIKTKVIVLPLQNNSTESVTTLEEMERSHIARVYQQVGKNKSETARILNISLPTLYRKIKQYNIN